MMRKIWRNGNKIRNLQAQSNLKTIEMKELTLIRESRNDERGTFGVLRSSEGEVVLHTLEPSEKEEHGRIATGEYRAEWTMSERFGYESPILMGTEPRTGIRIHVGNGAEDTSGCILVGLTRDENAKKVTQSRDAFKRLKDYVEGKAFKITIV